MISDLESRKSLIKYRLEQAIQTANDARFLIDDNKLVIAVNRIYYAVFYVITALALLHKFETSKHLQLIGWFNKTFIKENIFDRKYYRILDEMYKKRQKGDYEPFVVFTSEEVNDMFHKMQDFISTIE